MVKRIHIIPFVAFLVLVSAFSGCHSSSIFPETISELPENERQAAVDSLMKTGTHSPLMANDSTVHFLYRGEAASVRLAGDMTNWTPGAAFSRIQGTDLWSLTAHYPTDARLDYKFVVNDTSWILDPLNPEICMSGYGPNSTFRMPGYPVRPELYFYGNIPHGILTDTIIYSNALGSDRPITLYIPAGYAQDTTDYPVMYFHDGGEFLSLAKADQILDYLIAGDFIEPVIGVFVPPVDREPEYAGIRKELYTTFIAEEAVPAIDRAYRTRRDPGARGMTGISNGGFISLYIGILHPEVFKHLASQSGSFTNELFTLYTTRSDTSLNLYIDMGLYDNVELLTQAAAFRDILETQGYRYLYRNMPEGHSWGNWQGNLKDVLMQFFPAKQAGSPAFNQQSTSR